MGKRDRIKGERIILDENEEVRNLLSSSNPVIDYKKINSLAKYYYSQGLNKSQVEDRVLEYCNKVSGFNIFFFRDTLDKILKRANMYELKKSNQNIAITKKEIDKLKVLPHNIYRIALYMLFISKFEKYQNLSKKKIQRPRGFKTYFNYSMQTAFYNIEKFNKITKKEEVRISKILFDNGIIKPLYSIPLVWEILIADFESKDVEFAIESNLNFDGQIKYYCLSCGNMCEKSKKHDFCVKCYKEKIKEYDRNRKKLIP